MKIYAKTVHGRVEIIQPHVGEICKLFASGKLKILIEG
jgi:hypothetical protein